MPTVFGDGVAAHDPQAEFARLIRLAVLDQHQSVAATRHDLAFRYAVEQHQGQRFGALELVIVEGDQREVRALLVGAELQGLRDVGVVDAEGGAAGLPGHTDIRQASGTAADDGQDLFFAFVDPQCGRTLERQRRRRGIGVEDIQGQVIGRPQRGAGR